MYKTKHPNIQLANAMFVSPSTISGYRRSFSDRCGSCSHRADSECLQITSSEPVKLQPDLIPPKKELSTPCFRAVPNSFYKSCSASKITVERSGTRTRVRSPCVWASKVRPILVFTESIYYKFPMIRPQRVQAHLQ